MEEKFERLASFLLEKLEKKSKILLRSFSNTQTSSENTAIQQGLMGPKTQEDPCQTISLPIFHPSYFKKCLALRAENGGPL